MFSRILFLIYFIVVSFQSIAQNLPDLSDSILIYKYTNSNDYQLILSKDTSEIFYYSDSIIKAKGKYLKGKRNGIWAAFYRNGSIKTSGYITDSSFYGKWQFYHENGIRKAKGKFKYTVDDIDSTLLILKMSGKWKFWNDSGKLIYKSYFSPLRTAKEAQYGKFKAHYKSGEVKVSGEYHKGSKIGTWHYYYENGKKKYIAYYQYKSSLDYPVGIWLYWDKKGNLIKKEIYKEGKLFDTITYK